MNHSSVNAVDTDVWDPTTRVQFAVQRLCLSGTTGKQAQFERLRWWLQMEGAFVCTYAAASSKLKQLVLLEQMIVGGIKASCIVPVEASHVPVEGEEEGLLIRRGFGIDGWASRRASPGPPCAQPLLVIRLPPAPYCRHCQGVDGTVGVEQRGIDWNAKSRLTRQLSSQCKKKVAYTHCCDDEGKEDDWPDDRYRSSRSSAAAAVTERGGEFSDRRGRSNSAQQMPSRTVASNVFECRALERNPSPMDIASAPIRAKTKGSKVGENFAEKRSFGSKPLPAEAPPRALRRGRVSNGESVRGGQPGPGIWHQRLLSDRAAALYFILSQHWNSVGTAAFFLTFLWQPPCHAVGWIVLRYLLLRRQDDSRQKDSLIDLSHYFPIQFHLCWSDVAGKS